MLWVCISGIASSGIITIEVDVLELVDGNVEMVEGILDTYRLIQVVET